MYKFMLKSRNARHRQCSKSGTDLKRDLSNYLSERFSFLTGFSGFAPFSFGRNRAYKTNIWFPEDLVYFGSSAHFETNLLFLRLEGPLKGARASCATKVGVECVFRRASTLNWGPVCWGPVCWGARFKRFNGVGVKTLWH